MGKGQMSLQIVNYNNPKKKPELLQILRDIISKSYLVIERSYKYL